MTTHKCPKVGCNKQVPEHMLACKPHWFALPKALRDAIWETYRAGNKPAHTANVQEAYKLLGEREART